jgi:hypothetical protein
MAEPAEAFLDASDVEPEAEEAADEFHVERRTSSTGCMCNVRT